MVPSSSKILSHQSTASPLKTETSASEEKASRGQGGRSVSPSAAGSAPAVASTRQDASSVETVVECRLSRRDAIIPEATDAVLGTLASKGCSEGQQLSEEEQLGLPKATMEQADAGAFSKTLEQNHHKGEATALDELMSKEAKLHELRKQRADLDAVCSEKLKSEVDQLKNSTLEEFENEKSARLESRLAVLRQEEARLKEILQQYGDMQ